MMTDSQQSTLDKLAEVLEARKLASSEDSYVASLYAKGLNKILEKVGEESVEMILAAKDCDADNTPSNQQSLIGETADLWFHVMVALSQLNIDYNDVLNELENRFGLSGLAEKASRQD